MSPAAPVVVPEGVDPAAVHRGLVAARQYAMARLVFGVGAIVAAVIVLAVLFVLLLQTRDLAMSVDDCVSPGGDCYERGLDAERVRQENLALSEEQSVDLDQVLLILESQYPEAAQAVRDELETP